MKIQTCTIVCNYFESGTLAPDMLDVSQVDKMSIAKCKVTEHPQKEWQGCQIQKNQIWQFACQNMPNTFKKFQPYQNSQKIF